MIRLTLLIVVAAGFAGMVLSQESRPMNGPQVVRLANGEFTARLNRLKLWYRVSGSGPVCLFPSPGWGPSSDLYAKTLNRLEQYFTVVYLDTRGSGRSEKPADVANYRHDDLSDDLEALREHLGQKKVWVAGHSEGGWLAAHYALRYPQSCSGLLLIDSIYAHDADWRKDVAARRERRKSEPWYEEVAKALADPHALDSDKSFTAAITLSLRFSFHDAANIETLKSAQGAVSLTAFKGRQQSNKGGAYALKLEDVHVPTLIVVGASDDRCSPRQAERIHTEIAGSKLLLIEDAGHFPWIEQPDRFFEAVERGLSSFGVKRQDAKSATTRHAGSMGSNG